MGGAILAVLTGYRKAAVRLACNVTNISLVAAGDYATKLR